jgi:hypothetical protein
MKTKDTIETHFVTGGVNRDFLSCRRSNAVHYLDSIGRNGAGDGSGVLSREIECSR